MYTFTDITLTHKKLWHKTLVKNGQICEGCGFQHQNLTRSTVTNGNLAKLERGVIFTEFIGVWVYFGPYGGTSTWYIFFFGGGCKWEERYISGGKGEKRVAKFTFFLAEMGQSQKVSPKIDKTQNVFLI